MLIDIVMPQMGESLAEGTVVRWLKRPGDRVQRDEPLFEIATDKVDTDVPSSTSGTLQEILVAEGQTVAVGTRVAVVDDGAAAAAAATQPTAPARVAAEPAEKAEDSGGHFKNAHAPQLVSFRRGAASHDSAARNRAPSRSFSPAVLDAARRGGVPLPSLTAMNGSGRGGRITKRDVARFIESGAAPAKADAPTAVPASYLYRPTDEDTIVPMSQIRRRIADHMTWSVRISPHASAFTDCDMAAAVGFVQRERDAFAARTGAPLTYTVVAAHALAQTVREFPAFNASVVEDGIAIKPRVHLGIAVALADADELIVPVVRDADTLSIDGLGRAIADLAARARERKLRPEEVQGGTITLTNPGVFGGTTGTPILNQPQVAIVGLGAITKRAVVVEDADGDRIAVRPVMTVALTFDHRAADGMVAFRFLARFKARIEAAGWT